MKTENFMKKMGFLLLEECLPQTKWKSGQPDLDSMQMENWKENIVCKLLEIFLLSKEVEEINGEKKPSQKYRTGKRMKYFSNFVKTQKFWAI